MSITLKPDQSYPVNNESDFPVGQEIVLVFDRALDLRKAKDSVILFGPDFDVTSGPDNALWMNGSDGTNPFFLNSPGFSGFVECDFKNYLVNNLAELQVEAVQELYEKSVGDQFSVLVIIPKKPLKNDTKYHLFICGKNITNIDNLPAAILAFTENQCISEKTVYDPYKLVANVMTTDARISSYGSFIPKSNETSTKVNIKITEAGNGSEAKYKWWFDDENEPQPASDNYAARISRCVQRWRILDRGVLIKFNGGDFILDEHFYINVNEEDLLAESKLIDFSTSTDSVFIYPEYTSTSPLAPDGLLIPNVDSNVAPEQNLKLLSSSPNHGDVNMELDLDKITLTFSKNIDAATATQENILVESHPVSGSFDGPSGTRSNRPHKIYKIISVTDNKITLEL